MEFLFLDMVNRFSWLAKSSCQVSGVRFVFTVARGLRYGWTGSGWIDDEVHGISKLSDGTVQPFFTTIARAYSQLRLRCGSSEPVVILPAIVLKTVLPFVRSWLQQPNHL